MKSTKLGRVALQLSLVLLMDTDAVTRQAAGQSVRGFSPDSNWTWVAGSNSPGTVNSDTVFGARYRHAMVVNGSGMAFVFGGSVGTLAAGKF